jgi:thiol-disulfide isomerase/thioredoxin
LSRRTALVVAAAAVVATAGGMGARLGRTRREDAEDAGDSSAAADLWSLSFEAVEGSPVVMAGLRGRPLLLNFWATWCGPCVVEMPLLDRFASERKTDRWQVLALAIDQADPVRRFLAERTLHLPVALAGPIGLELSRHLGNRHGGLPFTAAFDSTGAKAGHHLGAVDTQLLGKWAETVR